MLVLRSVFSVLLVLAGGAKLIGAEPIADQFEEFGLPRWAMFAVGALEISAAAGVHFEPVRAYAAGGAALLMLGALGSHLRVKHPIGKFVPALVVLAVATTLAVLSVS